MCVWTLVWYFTREYELARSQWFWVAGIFLSGTTFIFLGLILGPLGRVARQAELPPADALRAEALIQAQAAAHPPAIVLPAAPVAPGQPGAVPTPTANPAMPAAPAVPPTQVAPAR
jgi:hypothetical protein